VVTLSAFITKAVLDHAMSQSTSKIGADELKKLFGDTIPTEVVNMLWDDANSHLTLGEMRAKIRRFAQQRPLTQALSFCRLARDAVSDMYTTLEMFEDDEPVKQHLLSAAHELSMLNRILTMLGNQK
jgi:hypothetical protein